jgi:hypothetical protein
MTEVGGRMSEVGCLMPEDGGRMVGWTEVGDGGIGGRMSAVGGQKEDGEYRIVRVRLRHHLACGH